MDNRRIQLICPISTDSHREQKFEILDRVSKPLGFEVVKPALKPGPFNLAETRKTLSSSVAAIADLSFGRPSCYYEVGLCEALGVAVFPIALEGTSIFQISGLNPLKYFADLAEYEAQVASIIARLRTLAASD